SRRDQPQPLLTLGIGGLVTRVVVPAGHGAVPLGELAGLGAVERDLAQAPGVHATTVGRPGPSWGPAVLGGMPSPGRASQPRSASRASATGAGPSLNSMVRPLSSGRSTTAAMTRAT